MVRRALRGDTKGYNELVAHLDRVPALVRRVNERLGALLEPGEIDDAVQEVVLQVWHKLSAFEGRARFDSWLYGFVRNEVYRAVKRKRVHASRERGALASEPEAPPPPEELPESDDERMGSALDSLDEDSRVLLRMRFEEGWSFRQMAEATGMPLGTIRNRFYRTIEVLRGKLGVARKDVQA